MEGKTGCLRLAGKFRKTADAGESVHFQPK